MSQVVSFSFNPFQENTFVVYDDTKECVIIDPGCYSSSEQQELSGFIEKEGLKPVLLINTHCHIDHIAGNRYVADKYDLPLVMHPDDKPILDAAPLHGKAFGFEIDESPEPSILLKDNDTISFGKTTFKVYHCPGHCPGHVVLHNEAENYLIGGDVLFYMSIGRTDLPGGEHETLLKSIRERIFVLDEDCKVYCGHYQPTRVGFEKANNPFLK